MSRSAVRSPNKDVTGCVCRRRRLCEDPEDEVNWSRAQHLLRVLVGQKIMLQPFSHSIFTSHTISAPFLPAMKLDLYYFLLPSPAVAGRFEAPYCLLAIATGANATRIRN